MRVTPVAFLVALLCLTAAAAARAETRIKDIANFVGVRANHLVGYGLVIGLNGTGDSLRNSPFTQQSIQSMLDHMGLNIRSAQARTRNIAAVMLMAELPAFAQRGSRIDVTVASLGDATSLAGGSLVLAPLHGGDEVTYAVAQGQVVVSAYQAGGRNETVTQGVPTSGRIPNGAVVERDPPTSLSNDGSFALELRNPDFRTAVYMADVINHYSQNRLGARVAIERDLRSIDLKKPGSISAARFLAEIGELVVRADTPARVVIDERTGTIIIGKDVQISTVAVSHGSINIRVSETPSVSQPQPFSDGETKETTETRVTVGEPGGKIGVINGTSLHDLVGGLNQMGLKPAGIIAVLQAIKSIGALQAELVVQ